MKRWIATSLGWLAVAAALAGCAQDQAKLGPAPAGGTEIDARTPTGDKKPAAAKQPVAAKTAKPAFNWDWLGLMKSDSRRTRRDPYFNAVAERRRRRFNPTFWEKTDDFFKKLFGLDEVSRYNRTKPHYSSMSPARP